MVEDKKQNLFFALGGRSTLEKVHKVFYDFIYKDPWLKKYFEGISQELIENQQTDFMTAAMGGPEAYYGKFPVPAHKHMNITEELFDRRQSFLIKALYESKIDHDLAGKWLKIDSAFRKSLVKKSLSECQKRFNSDEILDFPDPNPKS